MEYAKTILYAILLLAGMTIVSGCTITIEIEPEALGMENGSDAASDEVFDVMDLRARESCVVPYDDRWPDAQFPYAQAPDGCTFTPDEWTAPLSGLTVDFGPACDAHDRCYYTCGAGFTSCNRDFRNKMKEQCTNDLKSVDTLLGEAPNPFFGEERTICQGLADTYYAGVETGASGIPQLGDFFDNAQDVQCEYDRWVDGVLSACQPGESSSCPAALHGLCKAECEPDEWRLTIPGCQCQCEHHEGSNSSWEFVP